MDHVRKTAEATDVAAISGKGSGSPSSECGSLEKDSAKKEKSEEDIYKRKVKVAPELTDFGDDVSYIRWHQKGDLTLEFKKFKDKFFGQIGKSLG